MNFNVPASSETIRDSINNAVSTWHWCDNVGPVKAAVCLVCDRFITSFDKKFLSLQNLNNIQHWFYETPTNNFLNPNLVLNYQANVPFGCRHVIPTSLQLEKCILSPRASLHFYTNGNPRGFTICGECHTNIIDHKRRPKFSIINNFCMGSPPECLLALTEVELAMITPVKTYGYSFCFTGGQKHKLTGSLAYFRINRDTIVKSIGALAAANANVVIILYGQLTRNQYRLARTKNTLRIEYLRAAVSWLVENNQQWQSVRRSVEDIIQSFQNPSIVLQCQVVDDDDIDLEGDETFNVYYPDGKFNVNNGGQESIETLQEIIYDATINHYDVVIRQNLMKESIHDYKDNNLVDTCLLQFLYGRGGMQENRLTYKRGTYSENIDIDEYIEHMSMLSQPQFHTGLFALILYNMMMKIKMITSARWQIRNKLSPQMIASQLKFSDVRKAIEATKIARGICSRDMTQGQGFLRAIDAVCVSTPHSNGAAKMSRKNAQAIYHNFGCPSIFLTITPDDDASFTIQILSQRIIDDRIEIDRLHTDEFTTRARLRTKLRLQYPGICALYFELALHTVISEVFGWDLKLNRQTKPSLFGTIQAFTCSIEEQGRGTLHAHCLVWIPNIKHAIENLHDTETLRRGENVIIKVMENVASNKCFYQNDVPLDGNTRKRKRFTHDCTNSNYHLPTFPDAESLRLLRSNQIMDVKLIQCKFCKHKWSFSDLQDSYLKDYICLPGYTTIDEERTKKQLKTMAIAYQRRIHSRTVPHYCIDFAYNMHHHTDSCFKCNNKKLLKGIGVQSSNCRYRIPQIERKRSCVKPIPGADVLWYNWNGSYNKRSIFEFFLRRKNYDAFQNVYCPAISYSRISCNTNISCLMPGPIAEYCFNYNYKGTQCQDTKAYEKLKEMIEHILSFVKYPDSEYSEAIRRILAASFQHQSDNTIRPTFAAYLTRNKSRFIFSHIFVWCPLFDIKQLLTGSKVSVGVTFTNKNPYFTCYGLHYLCRPLSLEHLSPFDFFANYEIVTMNETTMRQGAEAFIKTQYFDHPSYNATKKQYTRGVTKRNRPALIKINQYEFTDTANFDADILSDETPLTDMIENYSQLVLLLFASYRCDNDIKCLTKYTYFLRQAVRHGIITPQHQQFLQNIQDSKSNSLRIEINHEDLDRASEPFHGNSEASSTPNNLTEISIDNLEMNTSITHVNEIIDMLTLERNNEDDLFDITNPNQLFRIHNMYRKQSVHDYKNVPVMPTITQNDILFSSTAILVNRNIDSIPRETNENSNIEPIYMDKNRMAIIITNTERYNISFEDTGCTTPVNVQIANGTAQSIIDWAIKCKLDPWQRKAFEIITGQYVLSYMYPMVIERNNDNDNNQFILEREIRKLEILVRQHQSHNTQMICFLHGPGGSGKSSIISLLQLYSKQYHLLFENDTYNRSIVITAMTGVAATIIGGETTHSALYLNQKKKFITPDQIELWNNTKLLIIDEISFASNKTIQEINANLILLKDNKKPFGGIHIVFSGDLRQLEPIKEAPLYQTYYKGQPKEPASLIFQNYVNYYLELNGQHRYIDDPEWGRLLARFREGTPSHEDISRINSRVVSDHTRTTANIKYATFTNKDKDMINTTIFLDKLHFSQRTFNHTNNFILIFADQIKIGKNKVFKSMYATKHFYENCTEGNIQTKWQGRIDPVLKLYLGCEVILTDNIDVSNGLANGTQAYVDKIVMKENQSTHQLKLCNNISIQAAYASEIDYIVLKHKNNIEPRLFSIQAKTKTFFAHIPTPSIFQLQSHQNEREKIETQAFQFPIFTSCASTGHKLQGTGVDSLFVNKWSYRRNWAYVILSRVKQLSGLFLREKLKYQVSKFKMPHGLVLLLTSLRRFTPVDIDYSELLQNE